MDADGGDDDDQGIFSFWFGQEEVPIKYKQEVPIKYQHLNHLHAFVFNFCTVFKNTL